MSDWAQSAMDSLREMATLALAFLPKLLGAVLLLVLGWVLAGFFKGLTSRSVDQASRLFRRLPGSWRRHEQRLSRAGPVVLSNLVFWSIVIVFVVLAARLLGLEIVTKGINALLDYLPTFATGIAIILAGIVLGGLAYPVVARSARTADLAQSELLGRVTQIAIIVAAAVVGATELGLDVSFLANGTIVILGVLVGAFALGLALGTPAHVSNVISARYVRRQFAEGDWILLDGHRGRITEIGSTHVTLESSEGDVVIPARLFADKPCIKLVEERDGGG